MSTLSWRIEGKADMLLLEILPNGGTKDPNRLQQNFVPRRSSQSRLATQENNYRPGCWPFPHDWLHHRQITTQHTLRSTGEGGSTVPGHSGILVPLRRRLLGIYKSWEKRLRDSCCLCCGATPRPATSERTSDYEEQGIISGYDRPGHLNGNVFKTWYSRECVGYALKVEQ